MRRRYVFCLLAFLTPAVLPAGQPHEGEPRTRLGTDGARFTVNGKPTFLLGISYYGGQAATDETLRRDLDEMQRFGFNWVRVWATWAAFGHDVSAVDAEGRPRDEYLKRLRSLVAECDRRGVVVDVTLSRGNGVAGPPRLQSAESHRAAVRALVGALKPYRNWYLDLGNERNLKDRRFVNLDELKGLRELVRELDPGRLVTASHAGDLTRDEVRAYVKEVGVDMLCPHRPRDAKSPAQTEAASRKYLGWVREAGRVVPLHYQEPFRRGFGAYEPSAEDFLTDLRGARAGGAAGWCFHNGDRRAAASGRPRRSFDLREGGLFGQLEAVERDVLKRLKEAGPPG